MKDLMELGRAARAEADSPRRRLLAAACAARARLDLMDLLHAKGTGHWGGSASAAELVSMLYFCRMNIDPAFPGAQARDRFILSKGHAAPMLYHILAARGYFDFSWLGTLRDIDSHLQGHPAMNKTPGIDLSTGALGHGISVGLGMALGARLSGNRSWTYVLVGEGCLNEGQSWEALMAAAKFRPEHFVLLVDNNGVQLDGTADQIMPLGSLAAKLSAFGWNVAPRAHDGHSVDDIASSFEWLDGPGEWPRAIVYRTVKGRGVSFMEGKNAWHGAPVDGESWGRARPELETAFMAALAAIPAAPAGGA